jgi:hypothetical protein
LAKNLWGDLPKIDDIKPPVTILKEQALGLEKLTKGILTAEVSVSRLYSTIHLDFRLVAPALSGYEYSLASAEHSIEMYPVKLIPTWGTYSDQIDCGTPDEFEEALAQIFTDTRTRRVIQSLLAQSKAGE